MKYKGLLLVIILSINVNDSFAQQFEKFSRFYDFNKKETAEQANAHYLYLYEYADSVCRRTEYYMKEKTVKAIGFFTDVSCSKKIGQFVSYYPNGTIESKGKYQQNKKEGLWLTYHENGKIKDSTFYKNNNPTATSYSWFSDGRMNVKREMDESGNGTGIETSYWNNGNLDFIGNWLNGKRNGLWTYHHYNGNKSAEVIYENNKIINSKCFDTNGTEENTCDSTKIKKRFLTLKNGTSLTKYIQTALNENTDWKNTDLPLDGGAFFTWVSFTVDINGKVKDIKLEHGSFESLNKTSIKIFKDLKEVNPPFEFNRTFENHYTQRMEFRVGSNRF